MTTVGGTEQAPNKNKPKLSIRVTSPQIAKLAVLIEGPMTSNIHRLAWFVAVCLFVISEILLIWAAGTHSLHNAWPFPFLAVPIAALTPLAVGINLNSRLSKRLKESKNQPSDGLLEMTSSYLAGMTIMGYLMLIGGILTRT